MQIKIYNYFSINSLITVGMKDLLGCSELQSSTENVTVDNLKGMK